MATVEEAAALITPVASVVMIGRYCTLSAWILLLFDHAIHFDKEVELFWLKPWSVAKGLYLFNRYAPMIFLGVHAMVFLSPHVTDNVCLFWFKFEGYTGVTGIAAVELILGFRVLALWNRNKFIVGIVGFALFAEIATMLAILSSTYAHMKAQALLLPSIPYRACLPSNIPPYFFAFWLPPLGYEFIVFCLASGKGYATIRVAFQNFTFKSTGSRLLEVMIRDSLWYFLLIFACDMTCALIWLRGPAALLQAVVGFGLVIPSVAGSHLLMNLRDAYYHPTGETTIGRSEYSRTGKGDLPTFNRSHDILASGGRHKVKGELDTSWALDSNQDYKSFSAEPPGLPTISGSTSTFYEPSHTRTIQFNDDAASTSKSLYAAVDPVEMNHTSTVLGVRAIGSDGVEVPVLHSQSPPNQGFSTSPQSSTTVHAGLRRGSLLADVRRKEDPEDGDAYELNNVGSSVHPHPSPHTYGGESRSPPRL